MTNTIEDIVKLAKKVSENSHDPSSKVGAVITDENLNVISSACNRFASRINETDERLNNRDIKYGLTLHAEELAIMKCKENLIGSYIFVYPYPPCSHCASFIIESGIKKVFYPKMNIPDRWKNNIELSKTILSEANVECHEILV